MTLEKLTQKMQTLAEKRILGALLRLSNRGGPDTFYTERAVVQEVPEWQKDQRYGTRAEMYSNGILASRVVDTLEKHPEWVAKAYLKSPPKGAYTPVLRFSDGYRIRQGSESDVRRHVKGALGRN